MSRLRLVDGRIFLVAALVALATLCCFHQLVIHPGDLLVGVQRNGLNDVTAYFLGARSFPGVALSEFRQWPWWNPFVLAGTPFIGNPQSALFYPPNWLFLVQESARTISWMLVFHHFWAGLGTALLARRHGLSLPGSVLAAVTFLGAPFLVAQTGEGHYNQICLVSWVPWAFLAWERLKQQQRLGVTGMALVMAMCFFCGHLQELFYLSVILTALTILTILGLLRAKYVKAGRLLGQRWLLAGIGAVGLVAVDFLPTWYYTRLTIRSGRFNVEDAAGLRLANLAQLLDPFVLGHPAQSANVESSRFYWETVCHFGLVPSLLAAIGVIFTLGLTNRHGPDDRLHEAESATFSGGDRNEQRRRVTLQFALLWILAIAFAFGAGSPLYEACHRFVPGIAMFRIPSRMLFFASFALAMLAGIGLDALARIPSQSRAMFRFFVVLALLTGCLMTAALLRLTPIVPSPGTWSLPGNWIVWAWLTAGLSLVCLTSCFPTRRAVILTGMIVLAALETGVHAREILRTAPSHSLRQGGKLPGLISPNHDYSRTLVPQELLSDKEAADHMIWKAQGYEPVCLLPYFAAFRAAMPESADVTIGLFGFGELELSDLNKSVIDMLGVRWAVSNPNERLSPTDWKLMSNTIQQSPLTLRGDKLTAMNCVVFENTSAVPRAFVVGHVKMLNPGDDAGVALAQTDFHNEVLLQKDVLPPGERARPHAATIDRYTPNEVVISVHATAPGYLVLSDTWYPGWTATVNDSHAPVLRANLAFRAVPLSAGNHTVRFRFRPPGLVQGLTISLLTLLLLIYFSLRRTLDPAATVISNPAVETATPPS